ncbi:MAG: sodium/proline symporter PutP [Eubacterium sp.]|nr:sodium/proline symporter PutP [Eubacterium sp.]
MDSKNVLTLIAFACYLLLMIGVGVYQMKKTKTTEDYFLGGRGLGGWVAALSAQASDMSGWLLMGLPGAIYMFGTGQVWIAIGLFIGTVLNWVFIAKPLRRYTIVAGNSMTLPEFFSNRFHDKKKILMTISSIVITVFFLVYTASALASGGKLFNQVFGLDYHVAMLIGAVVILAYTFMGGFLAVCNTDFVQGALMFIGLLTVPILAYIAIGGDVSGSLAANGMVDPNYLNIAYSAGEPYPITSILSDLAWGLGYCGMPHILVRFMAIKSEREIRKSTVIATVWVAISLGAACIIGIIGRAYVIPALTENNKEYENVFIRMIQGVFSDNGLLVFIGGIFLCGILAAIMSTADSQLLVSASAVSKDIFKGIIKKDAPDKKVLLISRITVLVVAAIAILIAWDPNSSIMKLVSDAWAGLGAAFGPLVVLSIFWKRTTLSGAIAGIITGGAFVVLWDYIPFGGQTMYEMTGLYSLLIGFFLGLAMIVIVSLLSKAPSKEILDEFEQMKNYTE